MRYTSRKGGLRRVFTSSLTRLTDPDVSPSFLGTLGGPGPGRPGESSGPSSVWRKVVVRVPLHGFRESFRKVDNSIGQVCL